MELRNFGGILNFAIEIEAAGQAFYRAAAANPTCTPQRVLLEEFAGDEMKNEQTMLRTRRENVTEMILEPISDFTSAPFVSDCRAVEEMSLQEVLAGAMELEEKAERFYAQAAEKLRALPEVSRALSRIGKKRALHSERLAGLMKQR
jgi:rubrerythrin